MRQKTRIVSPAFSEGLAAVEHLGKYGFIDAKGNVVIEPRFKWADSFSEGLAVVEVNDMYRYIDKSGEFAIKAEFYDAGRFKGGLAPTTIKQENGLFLQAYIDNTGAFIWKSKPQEEEPPAIESYGWCR